MTRVALLDDHPAVLAGLARLVETSGDLELVAAERDGRALLRRLDERRADVAVLDYDLERGDGLAVCQRLKERAHPPGVVMYSAYAGPTLAFAARTAGADAVVDKRADVRELLAAIRSVALGEPIPPTVPLDAREAAMSRLAPEDVPVAAMLLSGTSHQGIAEALGVERREVVRRTRRIVGRLRPTGRQPTASAS